MGIPGLNKFIEGVNPNAFALIPKANFYATRMAVDVYCLLYTFRQTAQASWYNALDLRKDPSAQISEEKIFNAWVRSMLTFIVGLTRAGIMPILVFDGPNKPEKVKTQDVRKEHYAKQLADIEAMTDKLLSISYLEREQADVEKLRRMRTNLVSIVTGIAEIMDIFRRIGLIVIQADGEAEIVCANLVNKGYAASVFTKDTDAIVLGTAIMITKIENGDCHCTLFGPLYEKMQITYAQFIDMCIMSGCDFNKNIPQLGLMRSYGLFTSYYKKHPNSAKKARAEQVIADSKYKSADQECLKLDTCRSIFRPQKLDKCIIGSLNLNPDLECLDLEENSAYMESMGVLMLCQEIQNHLERIHKLNFQPAEYILEEGRYMPLSVNNLVLITANKAEQLPKKKRQLE